VTNEILLDCPDPNPLTVIAIDCGLRNGGCVCELPKGHEGEHRCPCGITYEKTMSMDELLKQMYKSMSFYASPSAAVAGLKITSLGDTLDG
jgi:hypothetical protein